ncbi:MAG: MgtC/SapB family protein [Phycisphaerales bacterium]
MQDPSTTIDPAAQAGDVIFNLGMAIGAGLLVGLQRQRANSDLAGIRTFPLIALFGAMCGVLARLFEPMGVWVVASAFVALGLVIHANRNLGRVSAKSQESEAKAGRGIVTEMAVFVVFGCGLLIVLKMPGLGVSIAAATAVLLHLKPSLHKFTAALSDVDVRAIMQFAAISLVILPVVPNRVMGPFDAINPYNLWLMVVLVTGISLAGYVAIRIFGSGAGTLLAGLLGGLASSTATTVSFSRVAKQKGGRCAASTAAIAIASGVMAARTMVFAYAAARERSADLLIWIGVFTGASVVAAAIAIAVSWREKPSGAEAQAQLSNQKNPTELKAALFFAGIFAVVQVLVIAGNKYFGNSGLFAVAAISGLTDMGAITLSTAGMVLGEQITGTAGAAAIVLAAVVNTIVKVGIAWSLGGATLAKHLGLILLIPIVAGLATAVYLAL